jgi:hypothetical protein
VLAHNNEVCVAAGKEIISCTTAFKLGAMFGSADAFGIEKTSLISLTSGRRRPPYSIDW